MEKAIGGHERAWRVRLAWHHHAPDIRYLARVETALLAAGALATALALGQPAGDAVGVDVFWVTLTITAATAREAGELARALFEKATGETVELVEVHPDTPELRGMGERPAHLQQVSGARTSASPA